ncbi:hypothetical protein [Streptomyces sp. NPDC097640]|uniref:hypothetical protein n=1 Tax=Streptomyces sp. NPDC097640 TaxID=3157229 RepID=UPI0033316BD8
MGYDGQIAAIHFAVVQLTALTGTRPRVTEEPGAVLVETDVTEQVTRHWSSFVAILDLGTTFGLTDTDSGQIAWLRFELREGARP